MRVGFVTYGLDRPLSGVGRVALELGRALAASPECQVTFLTPYRRGPFVDAPSRVYLPGCRLLPGLMLLGAPLIALAAGRLGLDAVHDPIGVSPFYLGRWAGRFRRVVTLHDAIAFQYPQGYPWLNNFLHRTYIPATLGNVDEVGTDSHDARAALVRHMRLPAERVTVVPIGVSRRFEPVPAEQARATAARYGLRDYVLYVGAFQARKNVLRLVDAFDRARARIPTTQLALIGPSQWRYPELARRLEHSEGVRVLGYVPEEDLPALYAGASAFVLPSLYEGFGLPVLEAMACGAPVVCSNTTSLPEVAGDAALLVDPHDVDGMADAIARAVSDRALAADLTRRGLARAQEFTWERTAAEYVSLYREPADRRPGAATAAPRP
jgi:glycosyltransferase involved in cell wall biosynthesis